MVSVKLREVLSKFLATRFNILARFFASPKGMRDPTVILPLFRKPFRLHQKSCIAVIPMFPSNIQPEQVPGWRS